MSSRFTLSAVPALLAALSLTAVPAEAAGLPPASPHVAADIAPAWSPGDDDAANYRRWRHRRNRVDVGDVLAGVLIVGGIAAIAKAATRHRDYRYRDHNGDWRYRGGGNYPDTRYPDSRYPGGYPDNRDYRGGGDHGDYYGGEESRGFDRAVDQCVAEIEREERVQRVDSVEREGNGWRVSGSLHNGEGFSCSVGEDGRVEYLGGGGGADPYLSGDAEPYGDRQWDDDRYSAERARIEGEAEAGMAEAPEYEYPESEDMGEPGYAEPEGEFEVGTGYPGAD